MLAHSLHELARILGAGRTSSDLLPVFEEYCTKDVDDVKVGVLAHLAEFFEVRDTLSYLLACCVAEWQGLMVMFYHQFFSVYTLVGIIIAKCLCLSMH